MVEHLGTGSDGDVSFDAFFRQEHRWLAALATALCGHRESGRDVAEEAMVRTFEDWERVSRLERPGGWARRVVVNLAHDHARRLAVRRRRASSPVGSLVKSPDDVVQTLGAAVSRLPQRQRTAIALFYIGNRSISDVAEEMGRGEGTVKTTLHEARTRLRHLLSEDAT